MRVIESVNLEKKSEKGNNIPGLNYFKIDSRLRQADS